MGRKSTVAVLDEAIVGEVNRLIRMGRTIDDMIAGARVEVAPYKRHPADFVLWKPSTPELPGYPAPALAEEHGALDDYAFVQKPYRLDELGRHLRTLLDAPASAT
mgnify:CR=1 FL=1